MTALLTTSALPALPADPAVLADAAEAYRTKGAAIVDVGESVRETWRTLDGVYRAPEAELARSRMDLVRDTSADLGEAAAAIASALDDFADVLLNCSTSLTTLSEDITAARNADARQRADWRDSHSSDDGYEIDPRILTQDEESRDLLARVERTIAQAEEDCVAALRGVTGGTGDDVPQPLGPPSPDAVAPDWSTAADTFSGAVSIAALGALAALHATDPDAAADYARDHEADLTALIGTPPSATVAATWWSTLDPAAVAALSALVPLVVGNLGGVPYRARDAALRGYVSSYAPSGRDSAWDKTVSEVQKQLDLGGDDSPRQLVALDPTNPDQPRAAISVGLIDEADNVTFLVPGMFTTPDGDDALASWLNSADALRRDQLRLAPSTSPALVAWIGYDSPQPDALLSEPDQMVSRNDAAVEGGDLLADAIRAAESAIGDNPRINVVAHSYGTTVTAEALQRVGVDSVALLGSAGVPIHSIDSLRVPRGQVFAAEAHGDLVAPLPSGQGTGFPVVVGFDPWAPIGRWVSGRTNPLDLEGVTEFSVAGTDELGPAYGHGPNPGTVNADGSFVSNGDGYLSPKTESLRNIALITVGRPDEVTVG